MNSSLSVTVERSRFSATKPLVLFLFGCATLQFVRFYTIDPKFYLNLPAFLAGQERLPFQRRILSAWIMRALDAIPAFKKLATHTGGAFTADRAAFYLISLASVFIAGYFVQQLYNELSKTRSMSFLVYPVFLYTLIWTYVIHSEADYSYPYDMLAVAFFAAGLFYIHRRRFFPLLLIVLVGTLNRETTLFLLVIYALDATSEDSTQPPRRSWATLIGHFPWIRFAALVFVWASVEAILTRKFAHNNRSEDYVRIAENIGRLKPRLWPALLNICGFIVPIVLLLNAKIKSARFRRYLWVIPVWFSVMFYKGVIVETRIYGELCSYAAIALTLIMETLTEERFRATEAKKVSAARATPTVIEES